MKKKLMMLTALLEILHMGNNFELAENILSNIFTSNVATNCCQCSSSLNFATLTAPINSLNCCSRQVKSYISDQSHFLKILSECFSVL